MIQWETADERIAGTEEPMVVGEEEVQDVRRSHGASRGKTESQQENWQRGENENEGHSWGAGLSRAPARKQIEEDGSLTPVFAPGYTLSGQYGRSGGRGRSTGQGGSAGRAVQETHSETLSYGTRSKAIWGTSTTKGERLELERQWEERRGWLRFVPPFHAWLSRVDKQPILFPITAVKEPATEAGKALQFRQYEAYRREVFAAMVRRGEAYAAPALDAVIYDRQERLRQAASTVLARATVAPEPEPIAHEGAVTARQEAAPPSPSPANAKPASKGAAERATPKKKRHTKAAETAPVARPARQEAPASPHEEEPDALFEPW